ncbi:MAG: NUDIX domain-containing protein [Lactobacillaceae bacterium]|jgi:ADP-ribose pyrophosphatase YjhB (NUDIX family)|nr:NUDIX domain-containing protein [Lactobacillaceae bacterium]
MPYNDSYIARIREKVGHNFELIMPTIDVVVENAAGELMMIYNRDFAGWAFPGGYVEPDMSWSENAAREALEESGIIVQADQLTALGVVSGDGYRATYPNGDQVKFYSTVFLAQTFDNELLTIDQTEIDQKTWMHPTDIAKQNLTLSGKTVFALYQAFKQTQQFQVVTVD